MAMKKYNGLYFSGTSGMESSIAAANSWNRGVVADVDLSASARGAAEAGIGEEVFVDLDVPEGAGFVFDSLLDLGLGQGFALLAPLAVLVGIRPGGFSRFGRW
jgi:hypothetical protein